MRSVLERRLPVAQQGAVADAASRPEIGPFLEPGFYSTVFPIKRCGAAKRQGVRQPEIVVVSPFLGWLLQSIVNGRCADARRAGARYAACGTSARCAECPLEIVWFECPFC